MPFAQMLFPHICLVNYIFLPLLLIQQGKYENELLYTPTDMLENLTHGTISENSVLH